MPTTPTPTNAAIGKGTTLGFATLTAGVPGAYTLVAELLDIKMPKHTGKPLTIRRYDSPSVFPELVPAWAEGGDVEFSLTYTAAQGAALWAFFNVLAGFQITKPDGKTWTYQGIITEFGDSTPLDKDMQVNIKVSVSGPPVPAATSA